MSILTTLIQLTNKVILLASKFEYRRLVIYSENEEVLSLLGNYTTSVSIQDETMMFEHPIESGANITDSRILTPNSITVTAIIPHDDSETLTQLENLYQNAIDLKVRAGNKVIDKCIISAKPNTLAEMINKSQYEIVFSEYYEVNPIYVQMSKSANKSSVSRVNGGVKKGQPVEKKSSWLYSVIFGGRT